MGEQSERLWTLPQIAEVAGIQYRTLHSWIARGLLRPSLQSSTGTGIPNLFSTRDAILARMLGDLRNSGMGVEVLARIAAQLQARIDELEESDVLSVNGSVQVVRGEQRLDEVLETREPALLYRVGWATEAVLGKNA